jgi:peptidoglycan hydrolase CwlO-like protein
MTEGFLHASLIEENNKGYTEYGYRGLEELRQKDQKIQQLQEQISKLQTQLQMMENRCNDLQAKASR